MDLDAAMAAAGLCMVEPLVEVEDPSGTHPEAQAIARLLRMARLEIVASSGTPEVWRALLSRLDEVLDAYVDTASSGESFVASAGRQLGVTLVALLRPEPDPATPWTELRSLLDAYDQALELHDEPRAFRVFQDDVARRLEVAAAEGELSEAVIEAATDMSGLLPQLRQLHGWDRDDW